jgi:hypothetical protein
MLLSHLTQNDYGGKEESSGFNWKKCCKGGFNFKYVKWGQVNSMELNFSILGSNHIMQALFYG